MNTDMSVLIADTITLVHTVCALAVTVHVLLHKRDVGSAIGWMGLAWLSPIIGSVLYVVFGINRVRRKAYRISRGRPPFIGVAKGRDIAGTGEAKQEGGAVERAGPLRDDHLAPLVQAVAAITQRPLMPGNAITTLRNGDEAYPAMLAAIDQARRSIALCSYIFRADAAGDRFIAALAAAQKRGIEVRVLIDGVGSGYFFSPTLSRLLGKGVKAARFMHSLVPWQMPFLNLRNHRKILVVDGQHAFIGGINISEGNLLENNPSDPIRDVHFHVTGPVVWQIAEAFAADWYFTSGEALAGDAWFPRLSATGSAQCRIVTSGPDVDIEKMDLMFLQAIGSARKSIKVATPYFLPEDRLITALCLAAMRGVDVDVVIPIKSDHFLMDWATRAHVGPLLAAGGRLWRAPKPFDHTKLLAVDGEWALIGSANWDVRSMRLNFEINMEVYDRDFAVAVEAQVTQRMGRELTTKRIRNRPFLIRLRDRAARLLLPYL
ncbi:MAG TPA: cardiolipin synthase [Dongiaceae bacterium]|nr:cardiolipin synthase [Dongiaceae bacterium]